MFGKSKYNLEMIRPSSKIALKTSCLMACKGDLEEADKLYNFYMKDMTDIPDFDIPPKTTLDQVRDTASGMVEWFKNNQDVIVTGVEMIQSLRGGASVPTSPASVAPIPNPNSK